MKTILLLIICLCSNLLLHAQVSKTVELTAGNLKTTLTADELNTVTDLTLTGTIDARDFKTIHDELPLLKVLDLSGTTIEAYRDTTYGNNILHPANAIPAAIFEWNDSPQTSYALSQDSNLVIVKLPISLTTIGYRAFYGCVGLTSMNLPPSVVSIGNEAFLYCPSIKSITLPPSVTHIGDKAFYLCSNLTSIQLPPALTTINYYTFAECIALRSVGIPESVTSIVDYAFFGCSELQSVVIPSSVTTIGNSVFEGCSSLSSVLIPSSVTSIGSYAFKGDSSISTITIPLSVSSIGASAFNECRNLASIYCHAVQPVDISNTDGGGVFGDVDTTRCILYIPIGTLELYESAFGWKDFRNIVEMTVGVNEKEQNISRFTCYPNPFTQQVAINIQNPQHVKITVDIYNMTGQRIINLVQGNMDEHLNLMWNGTNDMGQKVPPGVYLIKMNEQVRQVVKGR